MAECNARAMDLYIEMGFRDVIFVGDANEIIVAVKSEEEDESWKGQIIEDIKQIFRTSELWTIAFLHRRK